MSAESVDQEDEEVEEVMEAEIVSLTLDPPPATAAAVLHQHHLHHHSHHHGPNACHEQCAAETSSSIISHSSQETKKLCDHDSSEIKVIDNGGLNMNNDSMENGSLTPQTLPLAGGPIYELHSSTSESVKDENKVPEYPPDVIDESSSSLLSFESESAVPRSLKSEILPKKSSFPCLKSKSSDDDGNIRIKKSVKFPNDESIISMKVEPVNPWKDGN